MIGKPGILERIYATQEHSFSSPGLIAFTGFTGVIDTILVGVIASANALCIKGSGRLLNAVVVNR
jgi:hypothetical protein